MASTWDNMTRMCLSTHTHKQIKQCNKKTNLGRILHTESVPEITHRCKLMNEVSGFSYVVCRVLVGYPSEEHAKEND